MGLRTGNDVAIAFLLTIAAGFATCIGGLVIYSKRLVYLANPVSLAMALSTSCGVMLFISLVEIFNESVENFEDAFLNDSKAEKLNSAEKGHALLFTTLLFITGAALIYILDHIVHKIVPDHELKVEDLKDIRDSFNYHEPKPATSYSQVEELLTEESKRQLSRTGMLTAIAIGIHNLPEGIVTFVGALNDTKFGVALAVGIALHNIPEGIAVAAPVYFATGSRAKGFFWTLISAVVQPLGALLAWTVMGDDENYVLSGVLFGLVSGMMVGICVKELFPTAREYCPEGNLVSFGVLGGMVVMATSLIVLNYAGV